MKRLLFVGLIFLSSCASYHHYHNQSDLVYDFRYEYDRMRYKREWIKKQEEKSKIEELENQLDWIMENNYSYECNISTIILNGTEWEQIRKQYKRKSWKQLYEENKKKEIVPSYIPADIGETDFMKKKKAR